MTTLYRTFVVAALLYPGFASAEPPAEVRATQLIAEAKALKADADDLVTDIDAAVADAKKSVESIVAYGNYRRQLFAEEWENVASIDKRCFRVVSQNDAEVDREREWCRKAYERWSTRMDQIRSYGLDNFERGERLVVLTASTTQSLRASPH